MNNSCFLVSGNLKMKVFFTAKNKRKTDPAILIWGELNKAAAATLEILFLWNG